MRAGALYRADDPELVAARLHADGLVHAYNATGAGDAAARAALLGALLGAVGANTVLRAPYFTCYGVNTRIGRDVFPNFGCAVLDVAAVTIGDGAQIGPYVQLLTADHPRDPALRRQGLECGKPVRIGPNAWIGGGAIVLPGVTVGDDAIIGAGSVVTRNVPAGATVMGNPARVRPAAR